MSSKKPHFYITTTLPYVNAEPHVGFAMELVRADVIARWKSSDHEVFFNTGTDEHGIKIQRKAAEEGIETQEYVDQYASIFKDLVSRLGLWKDVYFIRTTDSYHKAAAQEFWRRCKAAGDIYKKTYKIKYCVGCELEKTDSDLVNGKCPLHPGLSIELIDEENYFFKFSNYQKKLLDLYEKNPQFVIPDFRFNEIKAFVGRGLEDFSISRLKTKMSWGVPVPDDPDHVMYVWFDALVNYVSAIGWPTDMKNFETWWPVTQYAGKDNLRQQSAMWQAMLMSAKLPPSKQIIINGFVTGEGGVKMSKSLGNVISPFDIINEYGADALRYFVCRELSPFEDSPFTMEIFKDRYNTALANGLGNLISRIMKMSVSNDIFFDEKRFVAKDSMSKNDVFIKKYEQGLEEFDLKKSMDAVWEVISHADSAIQNKQPFKLIKTDRLQAENDIQWLLYDLKTISKMLMPFLPNIALEVEKLIKENKIPEKPLFPRKD